MFAITKEVYFCYGHRLMQHAGKCRHVHGHSVKAAITLSTEHLDDQDMVCDFADLAECVHGYIDREIDHNLLLHRDDPLVPLLSQAGERFLALPQHPTAEVLAQMIHAHVQSCGYPVRQVVLWETSSASASYGEIDR
jgi:6-pyruvoyltetrahydropterin/6-carboxytetrahydropterin synthase